MYTRPDAPFHETNPCWMGSIVSKEEERERRRKRRETVVESPYILFQYYDYFAAALLGPDNETIHPLKISHLNLNLTSTTPNTYNQHTSLFPSTQRYFPSLIDLCLVDLSCSSFLPISSSFFLFLLTPSFRHRCTLPLFAFCRASESAITIITSTSTSKNSIFPNLIPLAIWRG